MDIINKKKGQGLPLQTIVIAILVIIVLLVIVVFFVAKMGNAGGDVDKTSNNLKDCNMNNPAINTIYSDVEEGDGDGNCDEGFSSIPGIPDCCGKPKTIS